MAIAHFYLATENSSLKNGQKSGQKPGFGQILKGKKWAENYTKYRIILYEIPYKMAYFWLFFVIF